MFPFSLLSLKSIFSLLVLLISLGIGSFLYLTLDDDFEAKPRMSLRSTGSNPLKGNLPIDEINQIINSARQAWSIVDKK
jgi:hypothetical protein